MTLKLALGFLSDSLPVCPSKQDVDVDKELRCEAEAHTKPDATKLKI